MKIFSGQPKSNKCPPKGAANRASTGISHSIGICPATPHILFFTAYNAIYYVPLLLTFLLGYREGGVGAALNFTPEVMIKISFIYLIGLLSFVCGAKLRAFVQFILRATKSAPRVQRSKLRIELSDRIAIAALCTIFIASKVALIPLGVYHSYAFDTSTMTNGIWTFSMACSESLLFVSILVLFSAYRYRVWAFWILTFINGLNLLHGTRLFFVIAIVAITLYAFMRGYISVRRAIVIGPIAFIAMLGVAYVVFLERASVGSSGTISAIKLLSPLIYESVFSQISLVGTVSHPAVWGGIDSMMRFGLDIFVNSIPHILAPDKRDLIYMTQFSYLSPMGAFNGYAEGLLYLGYMFPGFYFLLGIAADWLYLESQRNAWWLILYAYFTADFLYRIMRDGYLIPIKMFINCMEIVFLLIALRTLFRTQFQSAAKSVTN